MSTSSHRPLALVTGASSGIGYELARQFADNGFDLIVTAEDAELNAAAERLRDDGAQVTAVRADLATDAGVDEVYGAVRASGRPLAAAVLNAGVGAGGAFATDTDLADELRIVDLNVRSTVHLAKHVVRDMVARDRAGSSSRRRSRRRCPAPSKRSTTPRSPSCSPSRWRCAKSSRTAA